MITVEELNKLKLANTIINRGSRKLGLRPLYINKQELKDSSSNKLNLIAKQLKEKSKSKTNKKSSFKFNNLKSALFFVLAIVIIFSFIFVFNPVDISHEVEKHLSKKINTIDKQQISKVLDSDRSLVITSGTFKSTNEAQRFQKELSERLGVPLKVLKAEKFYTVQIGPNYQSQEDALLVFDELSRYSIGNLSLRFTE